MAHSLLSKVNTAFDDSRFDVLCDAVWTLFWVPRVEDHALQMMNLFLECGIVKTWMFVCLVCPCNVKYWISFQPIAANCCIKNIVQLLLVSSISRPRLIFLVFTSTNHNARNRNPEMVMGRTERNLHSYMAEFIKLVNGYNTFSTGTKVSRQ